MSLISAEKMESWLKAIGSNPTRSADPNANWSFEIDYPAKTPHRLRVANPKAQPQAVVVITAVSVSPEHQKAFVELDDTDKEKFLWDLRRSLNRNYAEFTLLGATSPLACPTAIQITATRFDDGLTLDSFARTVSSVFKTELGGIMCVQEHLGGRGFGRPGQFDFKRLGIS